MLHGQISRHRHRELKVHAMLSEDQLRVRTLGECKIESPLKPVLDFRQHSVNYVDEADRILLDNTVSTVTKSNLASEQLTGLEPAGARRRRTGAR